MLKRLLAIIATVIIFALMAVPCGAEDGSQRKDQTTNEVIVTLKRMVTGSTIRDQNATNISLTLTPVYASLTIHF